MVRLTPLTSKLQAADVKMRRWGGYQWTRRACLVASLVFMVFTALHHRAHNALESGGVSAQDGWPVWTAFLFGGRQESVVGAPWTVQILGLEFLDPLAAAGALLAGADVQKVLWGLWPTLLLVLLLGRFFCGWICPYALLVGASNALRALLVRVGFTPRDVPLPGNLAYGVLATLLLAGALTGSQLAPLLYPPSIIHRELLKAVYFGGLGGGVVVLAVLFAFDTLVARAGFCRYLCPGGAMFRLLGRRSPVRIVRTAALCTDCTACDVVCNFLQSPMTDQHDSACERCGRCVSSCPTGALTIAGHVRLPVLTQPQRGDIP